MSTQLSDSKGRLYYYDNAKFLLIFFVVLAHFLSPLQSKSLFCEVTWNVINVFHMPTFIFISGFFAKSYIAKDNSLKVQRTTNYVILFLVSQILVTAFELLVLKSDFMPSIFLARSSLWFLQCLIWWHLVLPYVARFKSVLVLVFSVLVALAVGYETQCGNFLSISRAFVHFPFFMLGYYCSQNSIDKLFKPAVRVSAAIFLVLIIVLVSFFPEIGVGGILTCNIPYVKISALNVLPIALRWVARAGFYIAAVMIGGSFLAIVPRRKTLFTSLGSKSLSVYILHRFLRLAYMQYEWYDYFASSKGIVFLCVFSLLLTVIFSLKPFTLLFDYLQKIKIDPLLKKISENR